MEKHSSQGAEPFEAPLVESAEFDSEYLRAIEHNPEVVVRLVHEKMAEGSKLTDSREVYEELKDAGIDIPKFNFVIGKGPEDTGAYVLTEKIHGVDLRDKLAEKDAEFIHTQAEPLYQKLIGYYRGKYEHGGNYAVDMYNRQFMFGSTAKNPQEKLLLIDIDPVFMKFDKEKADPVMETRFFGRVADVANMVVEGEALSGLKCEEARADLAQLTSEMKHGSELARGYAGEIEDAVTEGKQIDWHDWMDRLFPDE